MSSKLRALESTLSFVSRSQRVGPRCALRAACFNTASKPAKALFSFQRWRIVESAGILGFSLSLSFALALQVSSNLYAEAPPEDDKQAPSLPADKRLIRITELRDHDEHSDRPWIARGTSVYDITDWVGGHPGGDVILRAAGGSVEPYWKIFAIHQKPEVYDLLEEFLIGTVDPRDLKDGKIPADDIEDPFQNDPVRDPQLLVHSDKPCNAETPMSSLSDFLTPNKIFYVRNHLWVPQTSESTHKVVVELSDGEETEYSMEDLKTKFPQHKIIATLQCSGNRRKHMTEGSRPTNGLQWDAGAIGNAEWTGPCLRDVLADAGFSTDNPPEDAKHAQFVGAEAYGASIPVIKAIDARGDVILAHQMNGKDLLPDHGFPVRIVAPGHVAARSVKWVTRIIISEEESTSQWQRRDYKCFGPNDTSKPDWDRAPAIQEMPVQSAITSIHTQDSGTEPKSDNDDIVVVKGYAYSGGGRKIVRVDVSTDDGATWDQADIDYDAESGGRNWSWKRWKYTAPKTRVGSRVIVKAVDEAYNTQPDSHEPTYNLRGNLATAWHRVPYGPQSGKSES